MKDHESMNKELITKSEAARLLGLDRATVTKMIDRGQLDVVPVGDLDRIRKSQVLSILHWEKK